MYKEQNAKQSVCYRPPISPRLQAKRRLESEAREATGYWKWSAYAMEKGK